MTSTRILLESARDAAIPAFSGAVVLASLDGIPVIDESVGSTVAWADDRGTPWQGAVDSVTPDTLFDLASITKLFTAAATLLALDESGLRPDARAGGFVPELGGGRVGSITVARLLTHTAGFAPDWRDGGDEAGTWRRFRHTRPVLTPGSAHVYSCIGYIWAGLIAEAISGETLDALIRRTLLDPLGMAATGFAPSISSASAIAATEYQREPPRGLVHGQVHDEGAWALGGVAGNAGLFGSARDLLIFAEMLRNGGVHNGRRVLPRWVATALTREQLGPAERRARGYGQAMGARIAEASWMGSLADAGAIGHTGFTGTSLITEPGGRRSVVFLSNRVHPSRHRSDLRSLRAGIADDVARVEEHS